MSTRHLLTLLLATSLSTAYAQTDTLDLQIKGGQMGIVQPELIDQFMMVMPGLGESSTRSQLREQSVKAYMMPPRRMSSEGSALCYAAAACLEFYANFDRNFKTNLSPEYIDLSIPNESLIDILQFLVKKGTIDARQMPYGAQQIPQIARDLEKVKIQNYFHIVHEDTDADQAVFKVRNALLRGNPVLTDMLVSSDFTRLRKARYWSPIGEKLDLQVPLLIVGYDEELEAFEMMGFYGPDWATSGYVWIDYSDFSELVKNAFVLLPELVNE